MKNDSIQPYINRSMLVLEQGTSAKVAARALYERHVGSVVVSDRQGHIVGLLTDRDLASQIVGFGLPAATPIRNLMATEILWVEKTATIAEVISVMEVNGIRRVPVIEKTRSGRERCIGIITLDDLISTEATEMAQIGRIVRSQILRSSNRLTDFSGDRREQTLNRFNNILAKSMKLSKPVAERVSFHLIKQVIRVLPYSVAARFISQLPKDIHEDLLSLPAGPNKKIDEAAFVNDLVYGFRIDQELAVEVLGHFWTGLQEALNPAVLTMVMRHLPAKIGKLFSAVETSGAESLQEDWVPIETIYDGAQPGSH